jgi:hypothetical protein
MNLFFANEFITLQYFIWALNSIVSVSNVGSSFKRAPKSFPDLAGIFKVNSQKCGFYIRAQKRQRIMYILVGQEADICELNVHG